MNLPEHFSQKSGGGDFFPSLSQLVSFPYVAKEAHQNIKVVSGKLGDEIHFLRDSSITLGGRNFYQEGQDVFKKSLKDWIPPHALMSLAEMF